MQFTFKLILQVPREVNNKFVLNLKKVIQDILKNKRCGGISLPNLKL